MVYYRTVLFYAMKKNSDSDKVQEKISMEKKDDLIVSFKFLTIPYFTELLIQIKDKAPRHAIIGKSNPRTKVEVEVDGLLYFTSK